MKKFKRFGLRAPRVRFAARLRFAASLLLVFSFTPNSARAQTETPPNVGQNQRGIGVKSDQQKQATTEESKARAARPELVLQIGYPTYGATQMVFSPDGRLLATTTINSSQVKLWEVSTGRELRTLVASAGASASPYMSAMTGVATLAFSRDGRLIASGNRDGTVNVWDVVTGSAMPAIGSAPAPAAAPSASGGGVTDTGADNGAEAARDALGVNGVAFSPDGRLLASTDGDASTYLWDLKTGEHLATLISVGDGGDWLVAHSRRERACEGRARGREGRASVPQRLAR